MSQRTSFGMLTDLGRSPRSGDRVCAVTNDRDAQRVEGVLHLRHVPSLDYVQVLIHAERLRDVDPDSIRVICADAVSLEELEASDPLSRDAGWRRIECLDQARSEGLLLPAIEREGGTWDELFARLRVVVAPLLEAGWTVVEEYREESWEYGDSVAFDLRRGDASIDVEYFGHGELRGYCVDDEVSTVQDEGSVDPLFSLELTADAGYEAFMRQGWLGPPRPAHLR